MELWTRTQLHNIQLVRIGFLLPALPDQDLLSTDLTLSSSTIGTTDDFDVTVTVRNTGNVGGKEVIQVSCDIYYRYEPFALTILLGLCYGRG